MGNGFDLNLGLPTSYCAFTKSDSFNKLIRPDSFFSHLKDQEEVNNWVDVEIELKRYSLKNNDSNFRKDYEDLCLCLCNYINGLNYDLINKDSIAYNLFKDLKRQNYLIFDFNYTRSLNVIAMENGYDSYEIESRVLKVHGTSESNKIIFGVEDLAKINNQHLFLQKAYPLHYQGINLSNQLKNSDEIHFFGHSLGETDHTYFNHFFKSISLANDGRSPKKKIYFYYYGRESYDGLYSQLNELTSKSMSLLKQYNVVEFIDTMK